MTPTFFSSATSVFLFVLLTLSTDHVQLRENKSRRSTPPSNGRPCVHCPDGLDKITVLLFPGIWCSIRLCAPDDLLFEICQLVNILVCVGHWTYRWRNKRGSYHSEDSSLFLGLRVNEKGSWILEKWSHKGPMRFSWLIRFACPSHPPASANVSNSHKTSRNIINNQRNLPWSLKELEIQIFRPRIESIRKDVGLPT